MTKKLWEVDHAYYCHTENYLSNQPHRTFKSWQDFLAEMGDCDMDYNLLFRWDWLHPYANDSSKKSIQWRGDENYRDSTLQLFWAQQRKGHFMCQEVEVCRADEPAVRAWLDARLKHLLSLWEPLVEAAQAEEVG